MKRALLLAGLLLLGSLAFRAGAAHEAGAPSYTPPADLPRSGIELLAAVPFVVDEPFVHEWRAEKPAVRAGYLLALRTDPDLARTRETYEPVLYVGSETAERCNAPITGAVMIVLVPAPLDADGQVALDLDTAPIWFGSLELPERVDAARIERERAEARSRGLAPATRAAGVRTRFAADETVRARSRAGLEPALQDLTARFDGR